MILGNKIDIVQGREVSFDEASSFADKHRFIYLDVTATEPQIVHQAFVELMKKMTPARKSIQEQQDKLY